MLPSPTTIQDWKELSAADPELAAKTLSDLIEGVPANTAGRVFASLPSRAQLTESFAAGVSKNSTPLAGVPFMLKDLFDFPGYETTASSNFLSELRPSPKTESLLSQAFRTQGGVFAGKTHLNEFAYGLSGENPSFGDCPHPLFPERLSGGSSSGSAWVVKSGIVPIATGTDTGGSIRVPAAWCGVYGLRLSPNRWSKEGCFPLASSFDTAGWFCSNASDMVTSIRALLSPAEAKRPGLRGVSLFSNISGLSNEIRAKSSDLLESINAHSDPNVSEAFRVTTKGINFHYSVLQSLEALDVHRDWLDDYKERYDPVVFQRIERARHWSVEQIKAAKEFESALLAFFASCFRKYDYVALPATQSPAISAAQHTEAFRSDLLSLTAPGSFARCPVLTVPIQLKGGDSQGIQILYKDEGSDLPIRILNALKIQSD